MGDGRVAAAANAVFSVFRKETFDEIEPTGAGRREVGAEAWMARQPVLHFGGLVRSVVVDDQVNLQVQRNAVVDQPQEAEEFPMPLTAVAIADGHAAG